MRSDKPQPSFPESIDVVIQVPRGGFIKWDDHGIIDFVSPLPSPFNYGSVPNTLSGDGDREDALVLGPRLPRGTRITLRVVARVSFIDAGQQDPKWVCSKAALTWPQRISLIAFFVFYANAKSVLNRLRNKPGETRFVAFEEG